MASGVQEFRRSRQGSKGSRPLGIVVDSAKGFRERDEEESQEGRDQGRVGACIGLCVLRFVVIHFSFLCPSVPSILRFFPHRPAPGLFRTQTERASGVEVLLASGPPLGLSSAQLSEWHLQLQAFPTL